MFLSLGTLLLLTPYWPVLAASVGGFDDGGNTLVSAMMVCESYLPTISRTEKYLLA